MVEVLVWSELYLGRDRGDVFEGCVGEVESFWLV